MEDLRVDYGAVVDNDGFQYIGWQYINEGKNVGMIFVNQRTNENYCLTIKTHMFNNLVGFAKSGLKQTIRQMFVMMRGGIDVQNYNIMLTNYAALPASMFQSNKEFITHYQQGLDEMASTMVGKQTLPPETLIETKEEIKRVTTSKTAERK